uniref:Si:ch211-191d15.2 n=1 Tax=Scophthalmus maximus TaxID=52904 RepID=A0A8D3D385_SCOMX
MYVHIVSRISLWSSLLHCSCSEVMHWCGCGVLLVLCIGPLSCLTASPCPAGCCCPRPGLLVLCESLGLRSLPRSVPLSTSALSVARNQLCNVDHLLRPFSSLQELSLSQNQLARFPRGLQLGNLTRLDLENNRIRINSNCLRSVPESAFDRLPRLRSVSLANNLWACECDILYLYRWLMSGRLKMATDLVCTQPVHLAHRLLLNLSVMAICPRVLRPNESMHRPHLNSSHTIFFIMVLYLYISC